MGRFYELEDNDVKESIAYHTRAAQAGDVRADFELCRLLRPSLSTEDYLTRLGKCCQTVIVPMNQIWTPDYAFICRKWITELMEIQERNVVQLHYLAGSLLHGFIATTDQYAFDPTFAIHRDQWLPCRSMIEDYVYLHRLYKKAALCGVWVMIQCKVPKDVAKIIGKLVYNGRKSHSFPRTKPKKKKRARKSRRKVR